MSASAAVLATSRLLLPISRMKDQDCCMNVLVKSALSGRLINSYPSLSDKVASGDSRPWNLTVQPVSLVSCVEKQVAVVCLADPGSFRSLHALVQQCGGGRGRLEVASLAATEDSGTTVQTDASGIHKPPRLPQMPTGPTYANW